MPWPDEALRRFGDALAPAYTIERELGRGGMATVLLAQDHKHGRRVAVKVLRPELFDSASVERFLREIRVTARLAHPFILPLLDSGEVLGLPFYVMPFVDGESLRERLDREPRLPLADALAIAADVADALAYAHRKGVLHRDVKPGNILLADGRALVADFGIAKALDAADASRTDPSRTGPSRGDAPRTAIGLVVGTRAYMSPEQAAGCRDLDGASDVYSLGRMLVEMLGGTAEYGPGGRLADLPGRPGAGSPSAWARRCDVPAAVERIVARMMATDPAERPAAAALVEALHAVARGADDAATGAPPAAARDGAAAREALLQGRYFWERRTDSGGRLALEWFGRAVELDPACASAYSGIAEVWAMRAVYGVSPPHQAMMLARRNAERALALDPAQAEAWTSLALVRAAHDWDWAGAEAGFAAAIAVSPEIPAAHQWLATMCLVPHGRFDAAVAAVERARRLDPASAILTATLGAVLLYARRYEAAAAAAREALALDPRCAIAHFFLGQTLVQLGRPAEAVESAARAWELAEGSSETLAGLGYALGVAGDQDRARRTADQLQALASGRYVSQTHAAQVHLGLGEHAAALDRLETAVTERAADLVWLAVRPSYDPLRGEPRFRRLLSRLGLGEAADAR